MSFDHIYPQYPLLSFLQFQVQFLYFSVDF